MNVEPQNPAESIQMSIQNQENLYNELMNLFYTPLQYALEEQNVQTLQGLRAQWTGGNPPQQDRFAMAIQSLRDTVELYREQVDVSELEHRVEQLESMHQEITNDLQGMNQQNQMNIVNGGRRRRHKRRTTKRKRTQRRKTKRSNR